MRLSKDFFYTLREDVSNEDSKSGNLLVRAGYFKKVSNGIYLKLPLGMKIKENVEKIVRKHMNKIASEVVMPNLIPMDIFEKSGRGTAFGSDMFKLNDRYDRKYALGPTDEEMFVETVKPKIKSYKDTGFTIYQMSTKYRDEIRPRLGLIRTREFTMKDAYSFDKSYKDLDKTYEGVYKAYVDIFNELGLEYVIVKADTGLMGGLLSEEFQAVSEVGEDVVAICSNCGFASNIEVCEHVCGESDESEEKQIEKVETPNIKTIDEVSKFLGVPKNKILKTVAYKVANELVLVCVPSDREINETKLEKHLQTDELELAESNYILDNNVVPGYIGPVGLDVKVILDNSVLQMKNFVCGANEENYHLTNVNVKDLKYTEVVDVINVEQGDKCPVCSSPLSLKKTIEVGNTFKLGTKYCESLGLEFLDENNGKQPVVMGSYGIGIERLIAAIVEQNNDEKGINWPVNIAPYKVAIIVINPKDETQMNVGNELYAKLNNLGIDTLIDDRDQRPGVKFNDIDLIGIPFRITVGKKISENKVEFKKRTDTESKDIELNNIEKYISDVVN